MSTTIKLAEKFVPVIDGVYKKASLTSVLDAQTKDFDGVGTVKVMKITTTGLGDYSKEDGYAKGNASLDWETLKLEEDRSAELSVDRMDNEQALGQAFGAIMKEFIRLNVAPEVDAYRFAKYAKVSGAGTAAADLADGEAVVKAVRAATTAMDEAEVPTEDRYLFITPTNKGLVDDLDTTKSKEVFKRFAGIIEVPQTRFYTDITMNSGEEAWGFTKGAGAKDINFLAVSKSAVVQAAKMALPKVFDPDTNQSKDAWLFQYRLFHDAFAYENKVKGIYVHTKA
jgi:hypothetical protein